MSAVEALVLLMPDRVDAAIQVCEPLELDRLAMIAREAERCRNLPVTVSSGVEAVAAVEALASVSAAIKELEALREKVCTPLRKQWEDARAIFSGPLEALDAVAGKGGKLRAALNAWNAAERARQDAERRRLQREQEEAALSEARARVALEEAATAKEREAATLAAAEAIEAQRKAVIEAPREVKGVKSDAGTYSGRRVWVVAGIHDLSAVPKRYLESARVMTALTAELSEAVRRGERDIPGVTIEEREDGTFRGRR